MKRGKSGGVKSALTNRNFCGLSRLLFLALATVLIFPLGAAEPDVQALQVRNAELTRQLQKLQQRFAEREKQWRQQELWMAILADEARITPVSAREERLLTGVNELTKQGNDLALKSADLCSKLRVLLDEVAIGAARRAKLLIMLDRIEKAAGRFTALTDVAAANNPSPRSCHVLGVKESERLAILSIGSLNGAVPGLVLRSADGEYALRILAVRPYIAAAEPLTANTPLPPTGSELVCFKVSTQSALPADRD